jgi:flagellar basal body P-ring protein FlgI
MDASSGATGAATQGMLSVPAGATVQEVAAGLHAAGATSAEVASIFESLREVGALAAEVVIR